MGGTGSSPLADKLDYTKSAVLIRPIFSYNTPRQSEGQVAKLYIIVRQLLSQISGSGLGVYISTADGRATYGYNNKNYGASTVPEIPDKDVR